MNDGEDNTLLRLRRIYGNISMQPHHASLLIDLQKKGWLTPGENGKGQVAEIVSLTYPETVMARAILSLDVSFHSGLPTKAMERALSLLQSVSSTRQGACSHNKGYIP